MNSNPVLLASSAEAVDPKQEEEEKLREQELEAKLVLIRQEREAVRRGTVLK